GSYHGLERAPGWRQSQSCANGDRSDFGAALPHRGFFERQPACTLVEALGHVSAGHFVLFEWHSLVRLLQGHSRADACICATAARSTPSPTVWNPGWARNCQRPITATFCREPSAEPSARLADRRYFWRDYGAGFCCDYLTGARRVAGFSEGSDLGFLRSLVPSLGSNLDGSLRDAGDSACAPSDEALGYAGSSCEYDFWPLRRTASW